MLEKLVKPIADVIRFHKGKLALVLVSALVFAVLLFPYGDLSNLLTTTLAKEANIFLQFDDMNVGLIPPLNLAFDDVQIQSGRSPAIKAKRLAISPSLTGLITMSPGGSAKAEGLFGGNASVALRNTEVDEEKGVNVWALKLDADSIDVSEATELYPLPVQVDGQLSLSAGGEVDVNFKDQPKVDYQISGKTIDLPPSTIEVPQMGPVNIPGFQWSDLKLKGRLVGGQLIIEEGRLGTSKDALSARFKGQISMQLQRVRGNVVPRFGAYEIKLELLATPAAQRESIISTLLGFIDKYKRPAPSGSKYLMKLSGRSFREQNMSPLSTFD